jgi:serine/threonine protein kinase
MADYGAEMMEFYQQQNLPTAQAESGIHTANNNRVSQDNNSLNCRDPKKVGTGAFGIAIKCKTKTGLLNENYVVKYLNIKPGTTFLVRRQQEQQFETEKDLLQSLDHEYITKAFKDKIVADLDAKRTPYIVMENCNAGELFTYLYDPAYTQHTVDTVTTNNMLNNFIYQIGSALFYIHDRDIIHHDLKPENIFIKGDMGGAYAFKLADFGLYTEVDADYKPREKGSMLYLPYHLMDITRRNTKIKIAYRQPIFNRNLSNRVLQPMPKWFIDWYGFFCVIYDILCGPRIKQVSRSVERFNIFINKQQEHILEVYPLWAVNIKALADITPLAKLINLLMLQEFQVFFGETDDRTSKYYTGLRRLIDSRDPIIQPNIYTFANLIITPESVNIKSIARIDSSKQNGLYKLQVAYNTGDTKEYEGAEAIISGEYGLPESISSVIAGLYGGGASKKRSRRQTKSKTKRVGKQTRKKHI